MGRTLVITASTPMKEIEGTYVTTNQELRYIFPPQMWNVDRDIIQNQCIILCHKQGLHYFNHRVEESGAVSHA